MEILAELDGISVARATPALIPTIERLLADDPTSPQHVATTTLISDDALGPTPEGSDLTQAFARIDSDPNQLLAVILDEDERVIGTFQLTFMPSMSRGGAVRAIVSGARVRAGSDSIAIGKRVFSWLVEHARNQGARMLVVITDKNRAHIHGFYTTMGFRPSHDGLTMPL
ncbi:MAG: GNAT family N-acetyltransferase [Actinomycetes bacterium]